MDLETKLSGIGLVIKATIHSFMGAFILSTIMNGGYVDLTNYPVDKDELYYLERIMELENSSGGDRCLLLTGAVVLNRRNSKNWSGDTCKEVLYDKGQYAQKTKDNIHKVKVPDRVDMLARYLLIWGPQKICPSNVVYQGQNQYAGSGLYESIPVPGSSKPEAFCFE